jgi:hypothetical protein
LLCLGVQASVSLGTSTFDMALVAASIAASVAKVHNPSSTEVKTPRESAQALEMMGRGDSPNCIMKATGLSFGQIAALRKRHKQTIELHRERFAEDGVELAEKARLIANAKMDQLAADPEELRKLNARDAALMYGIYQDKAMSAMGENTIRVQHSVVGVTLEDAMKEIAAAKAKLQADAIPINVTETNGS